MAESNVTQTPFSNITVNTTSTTRSSMSEDISIMTIVHSIIGSVGIVANLTVVLVFLNHKKFRQKIPNIFIIHQVGKFLVFYILYSIMIIFYKIYDKVPIIMTLVNISITSISSSFNFYSRKHEYSVSDNCFLNHRLNHCPFGYSIISTDNFSQYCFVHRHLQQWIIQTTSLVN